MTMKSILTALLVLLAVSSVQARDIPMDSISVYCEIVEDSLARLEEDFFATAERLDGDDHWLMFIGVSHIRAARTANLNLSVLFTMSLIDNPPQPLSRLVCAGIEWNLVSLNNTVSGMNEVQSRMNSALGSSSCLIAKFLFQEVLEDLTESIQDEQCRLQIIDALDSRNKR